MNPFKIFLLLGVFLFSVESSMAQISKKEQRRIERAEKKMLKEEEQRRKQELVEEVVTDQSFVIEAYTLFGRYNNRYEVSPNTNFVKIEGDRVVVQTANNFNFGYNGLGGITINGKILDYKVISKNDKNISVLIQFSDPVLGHSSLNLNIQGNGFARAMVVSNWGGRVTFQGQMVPLEDSRIFQGRTII